MTSHVLIIKVCQEISGHEYWFLQHGWEQYHMNEYVKLASSKCCETWREGGKYKNAESDLNTLLRERKHMISISF